MLALAVVTFGLSSSTLHLGHPERAWRAFSQWRSSWLSREGVASLVTYVPALFFFGAGWVLFQNTTGSWALGGIISFICAVVTVMCTAYIYRSLKPIPRWHNQWVVPNYLALSAMMGALLSVAVSNVSGATTDASDDPHRQFQLGTVAMFFLRALQQQKQRLAKKIEREKWWSLGCRNIPSEFSTMPVNTGMSASAR